MNWHNVKLILVREVRDQLRDRRTLFMIFVLPILLYPLLGLSFFQVAQFVRRQATRVLVVGADQLPESPALFDGNRFAAELFAADSGGEKRQHELLEVDFEPAGPGAWETRAREALETNRYEAVLVFPADFAQRLAAYRTQLETRATRPEAERPPLEFPGLQVYHNTAREKSQITYVRVRQVLTRWSQAMAQENLDATAVPVQLAEVIEPVKVETLDIADEKHRDAAVWSKIFPFLLLLWALTGAFYPAVDLCAGEKERGTLETLLSSPAERGEIVWGKLITVMLFSMATVVFNLFSLGLVGKFVLSQLPEVGPPPLQSLLWLLLALIPASALFSALCLALAAFARSTKEGQYYLMPLVMITLPLVMLPLAPGFELTLGNSLIPVTGLMLLLRAMIEGDYWQALPYVPPVTIVTLGCCLLAIRWAIDQFNSESVLFREGERFDLGLWLKHLLRDRDDTPSVAEAVACAVLILLVRFFMSFAFQPPDSFASLAQVALATQLVVILTPTLLMAIMLTRRPLLTLGLRRPPWAAVAAAVALAVVLHPAASALTSLVQWLYPVSDELTGALSRMFNETPSLGLLLLIAAVTPAVCEELAFRGFILSGLRHGGHKWRAIIVASILFGLTHSVFQQTLVTSVVGLVIGYLAVQAGSVWPAVAYHLVHNSLALLASRVKPDTIEAHPWLDLLFANPAGESGLVYHLGWTVAGLLVAARLFVWLHRLPYAKTREEALYEAVLEHDRPPTRSWAS